MDQIESCKLLLSVSTSLYIRATLLCLIFYIHTHKRASKQTMLCGYPEGAFGHMNMSGVDFQRAHEPAMG